MTDCCPLPDPYLTSCECSLTFGFDSFSSLTTDPQVTWLTVSALTRRIWANATNQIVASIVLKLERKCIKRDIVPLLLLLLLFVSLKTFYIREEFLQNTLVTNTLQLPNIDHNLLVNIWQVIRCGISLEKGCAHSWTNSMQRVGLEKVYQRRARVSHQTGDAKSARREPEHLMYYLSFILTKICKISVDSCRLQPSSVEHIETVLSAYIRSKTIL